jgi:hypothetical protein
LVILKKFLFLPLELPKYFFIFSGDLWNVRAFFLLLYSAFAGHSREVNNGILEGTSFRGWFSLSRPFFGVCVGVNTGG